MKRLIVIFAVAAFPGLAVAAPEHLATVETECAAQLNMPPAVCACIKGKAEALNDSQQAFVVAALTKDKAMQQSLTQGMTMQELTEAGMFMTNAPGQCAKGQ